MSLVYLAGPINAASDAEAYGWRVRAKRVLARAGIDCTLPVDFRGREDENATAIVERDLADIARADLLLAYCWQASVGTSMEIRHAAAELRKPVIVVASRPVSPWLRYHATELHPTLDAAIRAIIDRLAAR